MPNIVATLNAAPECSSVAAAVGGVEEDPQPPIVGQSFHPRCGQLIRLDPSRKSASRSNASLEFNHGVVFSGAPLVDDQIFEIRIDKKIDSWSGSLELGVTTCDPDTLVGGTLPMTTGGGGGDGGGFPSSANEVLPGSSWIMSGNTVRQDGKSVHENYGPDLDQVNEQASHTHKTQQVPLRNFQLERKTV